MRSMFAKFFTSTSHYDHHESVSKSPPKSPYINFRSATDLFDDEFASNNTALLHAKHIVEPISPPPEKQADSFPAPSPRSTSLQEHTQQQDPVENLLDSENLNALLRDGPDSFVESLCMPVMLFGLIKHLTSEVNESVIPASITDPDERKMVLEKHKYKFPFIASDIFVSEIGVKELLPKIAQDCTLFDTKAEGKHLMDELFAALNRDVYSPFLMRYFVKVVRTMMKVCKFENRVMHYIYANNGHVLLNFVKHVATSDELIDFITNMLSWEPDSESAEQIIKPNEDRPIKEKAIQQLIAQLLNEEASEYSFFLLSGVLSFPRPSVLVDEALKKEHWELLFGQLKDLTAKPDVFSVVMEYVGTMVISSQQGDASVPILLNNLKTMVDLLANPNNLQPITTGFGTLDPPLGLCRVKVVEIFVIIIKHYSELTQVHSDLDIKTPLVSCGILQACISLFFQYPHHNSLHNMVSHIVEAIIENVYEEFLDIMFKECKLMDKIVDAVKANRELFKQKRETLGYMGHITLIDNFVSNMAETHKDIRDMLDAIPDYKSVNEELQDQNYIEGVYKLGGNMALPKTYIARREALLAK